MAVDGAAETFDAAGGVPGSGEAVDCWRGRMPRAKQQLTSTRPPSTAARGVGPAHQGDCRRCRLTCPISDGWGGGRGRKSGEGGPAVPLLPGWGSVDAVRVIRDERERGGCETGEKRAGRFFPHSKKRSTAILPEGGDRRHCIPSPPTSRETVGARNRATATRPAQARAGPGLATAFESADDSPGLLLWRATNRWQAAQRAALKPFGLTPVQFVVWSLLIWGGSPWWGATVGSLDPGRVPARQLVVGGPQIGHGVALRGGVGVFDLLP